MYFVVGRDKSGGTVSSRGASIGREVFGVLPTTALDEIPDRFRQYFHPLDEVFQATVHEPVYSQQQALPTRTFVGSALRARGADVVANLVSPAAT